MPAAARPARAAFGDDGFATAPAALGPGMRARSSDDSGRDGATAAACAPYALLRSHPPRLASGDEAFAEAAATPPPKCVTRAAAATHSNTASGDGGGATGVHGAGSSVFDRPASMATGGFVRLGPPGPPIGGVDQDGQVLNIVPPQVPRLASKYRLA